MSINERNYMRKENKFYEKFGLNGHLGQQSTQSGISKGCSTCGGGFSFAKFCKTCGRPFWQQRKIIIKTLLVLIMISVVIWLFIMARAGFIMLRAYYYEHEVLIWLLSPLWIPFSLGVRI
jgi:hypothetical protein